MPSNAFKAAQLHPEAHEALKRLQDGLPSQGAAKADLRDLLSAIALYTTLPQAAGMLAEYWRYIDQRDRGSPG